MMHLLLGEDVLAKDKAFAQLKAGIFKTSEGLLFDLDMLDASALETQALQKALATLPVVNPSRLVVIDRAHKLNADDVKTLVGFADNAPAYVTVVLRSTENSLPDKGKILMGLCQTQVFSSPTKANVFDMTRLIQAGRTKEALTMLKGFYEEGSAPLKILGALIWHWGEHGRRLSPEIFEKGLHVLEETDIHIKRSRLEPAYAIEKAVVQLSLLFSRR